MKLFKKLSALILVATLLICALPFSASAVIFADGDFYYEINGSSGYATLVDYKGTDSTVVIPEEFSGYPVKMIGEDAFSGCSSITSVTIPDTVKTIGKYAFYNCTGLKNISVPVSVTSMGISVFSGCTALTYAEINASISSIPQNTFYNCSALNSVDLNAAITGIGDSAFFNCTSLKSLNTATINTYGKRSFYNSGIVKITISDKVDGISTNAFTGCANLETVIFFGTDTIINDTAFDYSNSALTFYCKSGSTAQQYAIDCIYNYELIDSILGDSNGDGYVSISDVTTIQKHCAKFLLMDNVQCIYGDVNGDGEISVRDATYIQMALAKIIELF